MSNRRFGGPIGYGYLPDPIEHQVSGFHLLKREGLTAVPPRSVTLVGPGILDQGVTSSCTGHAVAGAGFTTLKAQGQPPLLLSPRGNYLISRCIDRVDPANALQDDGAAPNQNFRALEEFGCAPAAIWDPDENPLGQPCDETKINDEPTPKQLEDSSAFRYTGHYRITSFGLTRYIEMMQALAKGWAFTIATAVDPAFEAYTTGIFGAIDRTKILGWHYVYAVGYTWDGVHPDSIGLRLANSWSRGWGENGYVTVNHAFIDQARDIMVTRMVHKGG